MVFDMQNDSAFVDEERDDGTDRVCYQCRVCPAENCSKQSFKKAACWSYIDEEAVKEC